MSVIEVPHGALLLGSVRMTNSNSQASQTCVALCLNIPPTARNRMTGPHSMVWMVFEIQNTMYGGSAFVGGRSVNVVDLRIREYRFNTEIRAGTFPLLMEFLINRQLSQPTGELVALGIDDCILPDKLVNKYKRNTLITCSTKGSERQPLSANKRAAWNRRLRREYSF